MTFFKGVHPIETRFALAEGEDIGAGAGIEELDLEGPVGDRPGLAYELIEACLLQVAPALGVHIRAVVGAGRRAV